METEIQPDKENFTEESELNKKLKFNRRWTILRKPQN